MNRKIFILIVLATFLIATIGAAHAVSYCGGSTPCSCANALNESRTLTGADNLTNCSGNGLYMDADGITLDCNGYHITGQGSGDGIHPHNDNVTIKNCIISGFDRGIHFDSISNSTIHNNTIYNNTNTYHISQFNGAWGEIYKRSFGTEYATEQFTITPVDNNVKLRIAQRGIPFADVDQAKLMACGEEIAPEYAVYTATGESVLEDILLIDHNVIIAHDKEIEISWDIPESCGEAKLYLTANEYGRREPFYTDPMHYEIGENTGTLEVDGLLTETDGMATPIYSLFWEPRTGHPDGYTYIYASDDAENVYISLDITMDNTDEFGEDWVELVVGEKTFRIDDYNDEYGTCGFGYTGMVAYKHQTCEFSIPKSEFEGDFDFALSYYGTGATSYGGIVLDDSHQNTVTDNILYDNYLGIDFYHSDRNTLSGNIINRTKNEGIFLQSSHNNTFTDDTVEWSKNDAIYLTWSNNNTFSGTTVSNTNGTSTTYGINLDYSDHNDFKSIKGGGVTGGSTAGGLYVYNSKFNTFNTVNLGDVTANGGVTSAYGIRLGSNADNNTFSKVTVGDVLGSGTTAYGISIICADGNDFTTTKIGDIESTSSSAYGLQMDCSGSPDYNTLTNTQIGDITSDGNTYGIYMREESSYTTIDTFTTGNLDTTDEDAFGMYLLNLDTVNQFNTIKFGSIDSEDDTYGLYMYNCDYQEIDGFSAGAITGVDTTYAGRIIDCSHNTIRNGNFKNADIGLLVGEGHTSLNNTIENNVIMDNGNWSMVVDQSENVTAENNCWGLTSAAAIDAVIYDDEESNGTMGAVDFEPFDTSCIVGGGTYDELPWPSGTGGGGTVPSPYEFTIDLDMLKEYGFELAVGETGRIFIAGEWHTVTILEIGDGYAVIELRSEAQSAKMMIGDSETFDTDSDGMDDLMVTLEDIMGGKADLKFQAVDEVEPVAYEEPTPVPISEELPEGEPEDEVTIGAPAEEEMPTEEERPMWPYILVVGIIVIAAAIILMKGCPVCKTGKKKKK